MLFDKFSARSLHLAMRKDAALNAPAMATFYVPGAKGDTDSPAMAA